MISRRNISGLVVGLVAAPFVKAEELEPLTYWQDSVDWDEVEREYQAMKERRDGAVAEILHRQV